MKLINKIIEVIKKDSFIYLDDFLKIVLRDENYGYYVNQNPIGQEGDFITAPEVSQLYGEILALSIVNKIHKNKIKNFNLIELGPGKGTLMLDIVRVFNKTLENGTSYSIHFNEINRKYRSVLERHFPNSKFHQNFKEFPQNYSIIIANEFFDALPMCQLTSINSKFYEKVVKINKNEELFFDKHLARERLVNKIRNNKSPYKNSVYEVSEETNNIFTDLLKLIQENGGFIFIADYGYIQPTYKSTLQSISKNKKTEILKNLGRQDITYHVNFDQLITIAKELGLKKVQINTQSNYLKMNGINIRAEKLINSNPNKSDEIISQLSRLTDPDKMGNLFKILEVEF